MGKRYVVGIDIGGTTIKVGLFCTTGEKVINWNIPTTLGDNEDNILSDITTSIQKMMNSLSIPRHQLVAAGVGIPGFVCAEKGLVRSSIHLGWKNYSAATLLERQLQIPVFIDNDANLAAAGEKWKGAGHDTEDFIFFTLGTGIGGGIIVNGEIFHGAGCSAGEIGHMIVNASDGVHCDCGRRGCLVTYASAPGIVRLATEKADQDASSLLSGLLKARPLTAKDVFDFAEKGDTASIEVVDEAMKYLGLATANAAAILHPKQVIIGGGIAEAGERMLTPLQKHFESFALDQVKQVTKVKLAHLGNNAGITGAAWMALQRS